VTSPIKALKVPFSCEFDSTEYLNYLTMRRHIHYILILLLLSFSCSKKEARKDEIAFYHWKAKADFTESYSEAIKTTDANTVYMHYFDIESLKEPSWRDDGIYPTYVLKSVDEAYQKLNIIPVVYIDNRVLKTEKLDVLHLADRISKLIDQISNKHFQKKIQQVQIDCDWTMRTKSEYFALLKALKSKYDIGVTIRLHQIKFQNKTGVPPVNRGTLMLYNMGDLRNTKENSILESAIVGQYIDERSTYPLELKTALPLFAQTVVTNNNNKIKLIKNTDRKFLENDPHFEQIDATNFKLVKDTLYKGFYLVKGYNLKLEEVKSSEISASYELIKDSKLKTDGLIFYHLDDRSLSNYDLKNTIEKL